MTNKVGTTFVEGKWYWSVKHDAYFKFLRPRTEGNGGIRYSEAIFNKKHEVKNSYMDSEDWYQYAVEADSKKISPYLPCPLEPQILNNYSIF